MSPFRIQRWMQLILFLLMKLANKSKNHEEEKIKEEKKTTNRDKIQNTGNTVRF